MMVILIMKMDSYILSIRKLLFINTLKNAYFFMKSYFNDILMFKRWADQVITFINDVIIPEQEQCTMKLHLAGNSVGGYVIHAFLF